MIATTPATHRIVFTATNEWWELRQDDFETADDYDADAMDFVAASGKDNQFAASCEEAFAVTITAVDPEHTAIRVGDVIVSDGIGSDKYFVRKI